MKCLVHLNVKCNDLMLRMNIYLNFTFILFYYIISLTEFLFTNHIFLNLIKINNKFNVWFIVDLIVLDSSQTKFRLFLKQTLFVISFYWLHSLLSISFYQFFNLRAFEAKETKFRAMLWLNKNKRNEWKTRDYLNSFFLFYV